MARSATQRAVKVSARRSGGVRTGSVMTPLNWMCGVSQAVLVPAGAVSHDNWLGIGCFCVAVFVILFYAAMYVFYSFRDPDRLQTEDFNIASEEMRLQVTSATNPALVVFPDIQPELVQSASVMMIEGVGPLGGAEVGVEKK
jgi:heme/copper-type cytochrome/quinol oxidase subunit 2